MLHVYATENQWSQMVCKAFARGADAPIVPPYPLLPGDVFMYGALRGLLPTLRQAQREGRTWFYADNGYMRSGKDEKAYFRVTRNALQVDGSGELPFPKHAARERWARLKLSLKPWRKTGSHIVVCPPGRLFGATFGFDADEWLRVTLKTLGKYTDRELRVRKKMSWNDAKPVPAPNLGTGIKTSVPEPLDEDLRGAWALVTHSSNSAVEALLAGIPVFCTNPCGASAMGLSDLTQIEAPRMEEGREKWAAVLASNQWTLKEMREGLCWKMLNEIA
ncbi:MAG: hypothetical protein NUV34_01105 [Sulfuricaulis sp.]|nr:hypothetical protein [Sulfuricaulis sp.]